MAIVRSLTQGTSNVRAHQSMVDATVQVVESPELGKLIHIATYGSDTRKSEPKVSQTIQLTEDIAWELDKIIRQVFCSSR